MDAEYARIYNPKIDSNTCCTLCKNCAGDCAWSRDFKAVPGWKIRFTKNCERYDGEDGIKILYCPEFEEGDPLDGIEANTDAIIKLFEKVCELAGDDYRKATIAKYNAEREMCSSTLSRADEIRLISELGSAKSTIAECETLLGKHAETLKRAVLAELEKS